MSAPRASGFCKSGVAKVLSTATPQPAAFPALIILGRSTISSKGLIGDSK